MRRVTEEMRQTAMGGKLKEMCKETARSKVGREASGKRNMIDLRQDVGFRSGGEGEKTCGQGTSE